MKRLFVPAVALAALMLAVPAQAQEATGTVTVLHGIPELTVDVYVDGELLVDGFDTGDQVGPTDLPAGDHEVEILPAGADPASEEPALADTVTVPADADATLIAHLTDAGEPTLSVFANDTSSIDAGQARVAVRHTAAFGAVDVLADGEPLIEGLANPDEQALDVPAGTYDVAVTAAGDPDTEAVRTDLELAEGTAYLLHAIGDPQAGTFDVLVQTIDGLHTAPSGVEAGSGGWAADEPVAWGAWAAVLALAVTGAGIVAVPALARRR